MPLHPFPHPCTALPYQAPPTASPSRDAKYHPTDYLSVPRYPFILFNPPCPHRPIPSQLLTTQHLPGAPTPQTAPTPQSPDTHLFTVFSNSPTRTPIPAQLPLTSSSDPRHITHHHTKPHLSPPHARPRSAPSQHRFTPSLPSYAPTLPRPPTPSPSSRYPQSRLLLPPLPEPLPGPSPRGQRLSSPRCLPTRLQFPHLQQPEAGPGPDPRPRQHRPLRPPRSAPPPPLPHSRKAPAPRRFRVRRPDRPFQLLRPRPPVPPARHSAPPPGRPQPQSRSRAPNGLLLN